MTTLKKPPSSPNRPAVARRRTLQDLDERERNLRFDELQARMPGIWDLMDRDVADESVVVVPSLSRDDSTSARSGTLNQAMEERSLFLLLLLRQPRLRMIYVTSMPISEAIVDYYLGLLPGVIPQHARQRLTLVSVNDGSASPLSAKLLHRSRLLRQVRELIPNPEHCHLVGYNVTEDERDVALSLGIPIYGCDPRLSPLGEKTGCRRLFEEVGVRYPIGAEDLHTRQDLVDALAEMRTRHPTMVEAIVKLNDGVSGQGNAVVDLRGLPGPGEPDERTLLEERLAGFSWSRRSSRRLNTSSCSPAAAGSSRNASPVTGCSARASSSGCYPTGRWRCCPRTIRFSGERVGRATSAVSSRPTLRTQARSPRMRCRWRSDSPSSGSSGGSRSTSSWPSRTASGRLRDRAELAQGGNHTPVPDAAIPAGGRTTRSRGSSPRRPATGNTSSPPITSSHPR